MQIVPIWYNKDILTRFYRYITKIERIKLKKINKILYKNFWNHYLIY